MERAVIVLAAGLSLLLGVAGCPKIADVEGHYVLDMYLAEENCPDLTEGDELNNVPADVAQNDDVVSASLGGWWGAIFPDIVFIGEANADGFEASYEDPEGRNVGGNCVFYYTLDIDLTVDGVDVDGTMVQTGESNGDPDCDIDSCVGTWNVNGTFEP